MKYEAHDADDEGRIEERGNCLNSKVLKKFVKNREDGHVDEDEPQAERDDDDGPQDERQNRLYDGVQERECRGHNHECPQVGLNSKSADEISGGKKRHGVHHDRDEDFGKGFHGSIRKPARTTDVVQSGG